MTAALALLGFAALAAWGAPVPLARLTRRGASARAGLAAWLAATGSVVASLALAAWLSACTAAAAWPRLTQAVCRSVAGDACTPAVYRSMAYQAGTSALAVLLLAALAVAARRCARRVHQSRARTRSHAQAALLVGRALASSRPAAGGAARTVTLEDPRPAAYCVAGRPAAIVVTSGALAVLDPAQLGAVLAHERAHLAGRHHALVTATRALAAALPGVPLFSRGADEVARLTEMAADDRAARVSGRQALISALLAMATGTPVPAAGLAAATRAVPARVDRLLDPPRPAAALAGAVILAGYAALLALAPAALMLLAG